VLTSKLSKERDQFKQLQFEAKVREARNESTHPTSAWSGLAMSGLLW
jgi:hypothetical protein